VSDIGVVEYGICSMGFLDDAVKMLILIPCRIKIRLPVEDELEETGV
jgi:hypothetical protein